MISRGSLQFLPFLCLWIDVDSWPFHRFASADIDDDPRSNISMHGDTLINITDNYTEKNKSL